MPQTSGPNKIRILLVDDHIIVRIGLSSAASDEPDMEIVAEARSGIEAMEAYRLHHPDVVVIDLRMHGMSGIETIRAMKRDFEGAKLLVYSNYASGEEVHEALCAGASGFVVKDMDLERLLDAIRKVHGGHGYFPEEITRSMRAWVSTQLSAREIEVLRLLAKGLSNKAIGTAINITEGTVKTHVTNILAKLGVTDRTQAIVTSVKRGIIQIE